MPSDPRDPLTQRREALTTWERGLRPTPERRWVLWVALALLLVSAAWRGAEWLLVQQRGVQPAIPATAARSPSVPPPADTGVLPSSPAKPSRPSESYGVTKCISAAGKAEYSDGPCPAGSRATTVWVQPHVNLADGMSAADRQASTRSNSVVAAQVQQHEQRVAQNTGDMLGECAALDAHIKWVDAMARQPQGAPMQDWLSNERKVARDRQFRLRCQ